MGVPKRRTSKSRKNNRRSQWAKLKLGTPNLVECPQCHQLRPAHQFCPACGTYRQHTVKSVSK